jgi:hypothetical protein
LNRRVTGAFRKTASKPWKRRRRRERHRHLGILEAAGVGDVLVVERSAVPPRSRRAQAGKVGAGGGDGVFGDGGAAGVAPR